MTRRNPLANLTRGRAATQSALDKLAGKTKRQYPEQQISIDFAAFMEEEHPDILFTALLVGVNLPIQVAVRAKRMGVKRDWTDCIILEPRGPYHGLMIELKSPTGSVRKGQKALHEKMRAKGYKVVVARSLVAAKMALEEYLNG